MGHPTWAGSGGHRTSRIASAGNFQPNAFPGPLSGGRRARAPHLRDILPRRCTLAGYPATFPPTGHNMAQVRRKWQKRAHVRQHLRDILPNTAHLIDIAPVRRPLGRISRKCTEWVGQPGCLTQKVDQVTWLGDSLLTQVA